MFDRVTTNTVLQHVVNDSVLESIFSEVSRVLRYEGLFLISELVSPWSTQTSSHVKLRAFKEYASLGAKYGLQLKKIRHAVSTYATLLSLYGLLIRHITSRSAQAVGGPVLPRQAQRETVARGPVSAFARRVARKAISLLAKIIDLLLVFLNLEDKFVSQDQIVLEKKLY
jgi:hypothetical protein